MSDYANSFFSSELYMSHFSIRCYVPCKMLGQEDYIIKDLV